MFDRQAQVMAGILWHNWEAAVEIMEINIFLLQTADVKGSVN